MAKPSIWSSIRNAAQRVGPVIAVVVIVVVGFFGSEWLMHEKSPGGELSSLANNSAGDSSSEASLVRLTAEKIKSGAITTTPVGRKPLQATRTVSGTIRYETARHLDLRAPVNCVVTKCLVQPGQWVQKGDRLATLTSAEFALARNELLKSEADLRLAKLQHDWAEQTHANLNDLLALLRQNPSIEDIEKEFENKVLGDHRDALVTAYSQYVLATSVASRTETLQNQGIISGRTSEERASQRERMAASFKSMCEQVAFESKRDSEQADAELNAAERAVEVSRDRLAVLLGPHGEHSPDENRSELQMTAPFEGRIEALHAVESARLSAGESMFVLADTRTVWVAAQIHQRDWKALSLATDQTLRLTVPGMPNAEFAARVRFVGATVSPATLSIPLIAEVDNRENLFRPGMFVWVDVPISKPHDVLAVPTSAIQRHEERAFVFAKVGESEYRCVDVETGIETPDWVEVKHGLADDARVVDHGAFYLKSELLLEEEE
ncbi:MAG: efflux RND transporter periplasmic adaptor subunit [Planctomycetaceae bacterium]|nr:efflux RND transporter periplasmic adaptor subunit [Planctomycetales bacterium]MCB9937788.1 efflux RND transporter periplasmic adaptor subunit [Planctomycetaceae bacterium]